MHALWILLVLPLIGAAAHIADRVRRVFVRDVILGSRQLGLDDDSIAATFSLEPGYRRRDGRPWTVADVRAVAAGGPLPASCFTVKSVVDRRR